MTEALAMADIWVELIVAISGALFGWFTRHYQQPRGTRSELVKPNGESLRRMLKR